MGIISDTFPENTEVGWSWGEYVGMEDENGNIYF